MKKKTLIATFLDRLEVFLRKEEKKTLFWIGRQCNDKVAAI